MRNYKLCYHPLKEKEIVYENNKWNDIKPRPQGFLSLQKLGIFKKGKKPWERE